MKFYRLILILAALLVVGCSTQTTRVVNSGPDESSAVPTDTAAPPTETPTPAPTHTPTATIPPSPTPLPPRTRNFAYTVHSSKASPALSAPVDDEAWEGDYTWAPFVVYRDGLFHMFYNGYDTIPRGIGYATSPDGITFTRYAGNPVLQFSGITESFANMVIGPVVYVQADGTWVMYVVDSRLDLSLAGSAVSRYTASAPTGPWALDGEPVYTAEEGNWTEEIVLRSVLVKEDGGILLAFDARYDETRVGIGLLHSDDGYNFELVSDEPVLTHGAEDSWYPDGPAAPMLFATEDGYEMFFLGLDNVNGWYRSYKGENLWVGYATSPDGVNWEVEPYNPVVQIPDTNGFAYMAGTKVEETYFLYYVFRAGRDGVGVLTLEIEPVDSN